MMESIGPNMDWTPGAGLLIINADDWGRDNETTDRMLECLLRRSVSSVSAMVFMSDSERATQLAGEHRIDAGLHLNLTLPFSSPECPSNLREHQRKLVKYLRSYSIARVLYHPGLVSCFEYVVKAQLDEYCRLYGVRADRIDGHHHMHHCTNVLLGQLLPAGTLVRRNFSFRPGEKSAVNRLYRKAIDYTLARRHRLVDFLFSLPPLETVGRLESIFSLARGFTVELETHPINANEYSFLLSDEIFRLTSNIRIAPHSSVLSSRFVPN